MAATETHMLKPGEVCDLLRIGRTTLHEWVEKGHVRAHTLPSGHRRYPASQPVIRAALAAVRGRK